MEEDSVRAVERRPAVCMGGFVWPLVLDVFCISGKFMITSLVVHETPKWILSFNLHIGFYAQDFRVYPNCL